MNGLQIFLLLPIFIGQYHCWFESAKKVLMKVDRHHLRFNLTFSSFQARSSCQDQCHRQPRSCQRDISSVRQKSVNERPARVSLGIYFQFHFHYPSSAISMSLLLSNKSYFPRFTFKKKAFNLRNSGLTSLKLKSWVTLFSKWSVLEELASWKYHPSAL